MAKNERSASRSRKPNSSPGPDQATGVQPIERKRREQARQERLALQRRIQRRRRLSGLAARVGVPLVALAVLAGILLLTRAHSPKTGPIYASSGPSIDPSTLPGISTGPQPWPPEAANLKGRLAAIGLPALSAEGTVLHIHQHLDIYIDGQHLTVPADIGISTQEGFISPLHTHDTSGIIHVESPTARTFTLGEFFDVWGVRFTSTCIGGYCDEGDKTLQVFVDGKPATGDLRFIELTSHEEIVVAYGAPSELPNPIPSSHTFPVGD